MPQTGLIFDFDGVIVLSEPVHQRAWVDVAAEFSADLPDGFLERGIGNSDEALARELAAHWNFKDSPLLLLDAKRRCYQARCLAETEYVPGIHRALEVLSRDYPLAVATSSSEGDIAPHLNQNGMRRHFKAVLTIESVANPKPHPEIYLKAAAEIGVAPENCWIFEDSHHGAAAARAAGAKVIALATTLPVGAIGPVHASISNFSDLERILEIVNSAD